MVIRGNMSDFPCDVNTDLYRDCGGGCTNLHMCKRDGTKHIYMHTSTSNTGDLRRMDCVHGDALGRVRTVLLQAITAAGNGGVVRGQGSLCARRGALPQRVHQHEPRQRAADVACSLPRGLRPHGHSPLVCVCS